MEKVEVGKRFGKLTVLEKLGSDARWKSFWRCRCDCGKESEVRIDHLNRGKVQSCGCVREDKLRNGLRTEHGEAKRSRKTVEWTTWAKMIGRCHDEKDKSYFRYGGRGIRVCDRWRESYQAFLEDMGRRPPGPFSIERKDNNGNYEPGNCRWATQREQCNNRRTSHLITCNGETLSASDWARRIGIDAATILGRLRLGWSSESAIQTPLT